MDEPFGAFVRRHREAEGLTRYALAQRAGITQTHLVNIEDGKQGTDPRRGMTFETARKICKGLGVSLAVFDLKEE